MKCPFCNNPAASYYWVERQQHLWHCTSCGARGPLSDDEEKVWDSLKEIQDLRDFRKTIEKHVSYVRETRIRAAESQVNEAKRVVRDAECLTLANWLGEVMK